MRVAQSPLSHSHDSLTIVSTPPPAPVPPEAGVDGSIRHWKVITLGVVLALGIIFWLGVGYGQEWGAQQWGPFADWLVGFLTFGAVVVALRESLKGQHGRLIDHELARRRENLDALSNLWSALLAMNMSTLRFSKYFQNLPAKFDPNLPRPGSDHSTTSSLRVELQLELAEYMTKWIETVESARFVALTLLQATPFGPTILELDAAIDKYIKKLLDEQYSEAWNNGQRPEAELAESWQKVTELRSGHLDLARMHFSLDLKDVEAAVRRR